MQQKEDYFFWPALPDSQRKANSWRRVAVF